MAKELPQLLDALLDGKNLSQKDAKDFLDSVLKGGVDPLLISAITVALRAKGETAEEIAGLVGAMRSNMISVVAPHAVDIVGTGGDGSNSFNISTVSAFVVAGSGVKIAKHGNRAASSTCGSADVLEALGVNINLTKDQAEEVFKEVGFVFMMAPRFHPALKEVVPIRKALKVRTIFNILGPLCNPAGTDRQLTGVPSIGIAQKMAEVAKKLKYKRMMIVTSDGLDEVSTRRLTHVFDVQGNKVKRFTIDAQKFGMKKPDSIALKGGDARLNADISRLILRGEKGPRRDVVVLNSACALVVAGKAKTIAEGISLAEKSIDMGNARRVLELLVKATNSFA